MYGISVIFWICVGYVFCFHCLTSSTPGIHRQNQLSFVELFKIKSQVWLSLLVCVDSASTDSKHDTTLDSMATRARTSYFFVFSFALKQRIVQNNMMWVHELTTIFRIFHFLFFQYTRSLSANAYSACIGERFN